MTILISGDQSIGEEVVRNPRSEHPVKEFPQAGSRGNWSVSAQRRVVLSRFGNCHDQGKSPLLGTPTFLEHYVEESQ